VCPHDGAGLEITGSCLAWPTRCRCGARHAAGCSNWATAMSSSSLRPGLRTAP